MSDFRYCPVCDENQPVYKFWQKTDEDGGYTGIEYCETCGHIYHEA